MGTTIFNYDEKVVPSPDSLEYQKKLVSTMFLDQQRKDSTSIVFSIKI